MSCDVGTVLLNLQFSVKLVLGCVYNMWVLKGVYCVLYPVKYTPCKMCKTENDTRSIWPLNHPLGSLSFSNSKEETIKVHKNSWNVKKHWLIINGYGTKDHYIGDGQGWTNYPNSQDYWHNPNWTVVELINLLINIIYNVNIQT